MVAAQDYYAQSEGVEGYFFTSPSGRWRCAILPGSAKAGCQPADNSQPSIGVAGEPATVDNERGQPEAPNAILVDATGDGRFAWLEQAEFWLQPGPARQLPYNSTLSAAGFSCNTQQSGVSCRNDSSGGAFTFSTEGFVTRYAEIPPAVTPAAPPPAPPPTPSAIDGGVHDCGVFPPQPAFHVVNDTSVITCSAAVDLITRYLNDPRTQAGDRGAQMDEWSCGILGAVESEKRGYSVICDKIDGQVTLQPA